MRELTNTELQLLTSAADEKGTILKPTEAKASAFLIKAGLALSMPRPKGASRLVATTEGRALVAPPGEVAAETQALETSTLDAALESVAPDTGAFEPAKDTDATPKGKIGALVTLLRRPEGAGIDELMLATGWQAHSVRGALAGTVKKRLKMTVVSEKSEKGRIYRIPSEVAEAAA